MTNREKGMITWKALAGSSVILVLCGATWFVLSRPVSDIAVSQTDNVAPAPLTRGGIVPGESLSIKERVALEKSLRTDVEEGVQKGMIKEGAILFRDLNNGPTIDINGTMQFYPASLLKLPLAITYFKASEKGTQALDSEIEFQGPNGTSIEHYPGKRGLVPGTIYTLADIIKLMIEESDNDAASILSQYADKSMVDQAYGELGVQKVSNYNTYTTDVKTYSSFFRVLYNVSYLSKSDSETVLSMLAHTSFDAGLTSGVPKNVTVAHKFGERTIGETQTQLHDCGIVYVPNKNYILCVMTRGNDYDKQAQFITGISRRVYESVSTASGNGS